MNQDFLKDIDKSIKIFKEKLGYNPIFFSYPFGEYNNFIKNYITQNFKYSFGQHSGVIDVIKIFLNCLVFQSMKNMVILKDLNF